MELLKTKLLSRVGTGEGEMLSGRSADGSSEQLQIQQFTELLSLCRGDLGEILDKLRQKAQAET